MTRLPRSLALAGAAILVALAVPLVGLLSRVPWGSIGEVAAEPAFAEAWWLSLRTCLAATAVTVLLGTPLALWVAALQRGRTIARVIVLLPMTLPPVVAGLALLATLGRFGMLGGVLRAGGIEIGFTTLAVVIAQVFVAMPFFVVAVEGAAHVMDRAPARALRALGSGSGEVLRHAILPALAPALVSGTSLAFARALGEFGATLTFAGSLPGTTRTMPLAIYLARESDRDTAYTLAALLVATAVVVLLAGAWAARLLTAPAATREYPGEGEDGETCPDASVPEVPGAALAATIVRPERGIDAHMEVAAGRTLALVGPNGSGKSTVVEEIAGLLGDSVSRVEVAGTRVDGAPPGARRIALLTQKPSLLAHLTAAGNVELAARLAGEKAPRQAAMRALAAVGARRLANSRPGQLSGGQQALVALARALATRPQVILLDEPFAALDVTAAARTRAWLGRILPGRTAILVTHTPLDVAALADDVAVMEDGQVTERITAGRFLTHPTSEFGRSLVDVSVLEAEVDETGGAAWLAGVRVRLPGSRPPGRVVLSIRPERVRLHVPAGTSGGSDGSSLVGELAGYAPIGGSVRVDLLLPDGQRLRAQVPSAQWARLAHLHEVGAVLEDPQVVEE